MDGRKPLKMTIKGTHEELIVFPDGARAFITGVPDKCEHDDKETVFILEDGRYLFEKFYRCPTNEATWEYVGIVADRLNTAIVGQTSGCSKCGKVHTLKDLMGDAFWL
jgi:hypothetical protein